MADLKEVSTEDLRTEINRRARMTYAEFELGSLKRRAAIITSDLEVINKRIVELESELKKEG